MYKNISSPNLHSVNITKNIHITNMWKNSTSHQKSAMSSAKPNRIINIDVFMTYAYFCNDLGYGMCYVCGRCVVVACTLQLQ